MKHLLKTVISFSTALFMSACSVFGDSGVEIAPYDVLQKDAVAEIRHYDSLVLVTTAMQSGSKESGDNAAFQRLFDYISGDNISKRKIEMTAPVIMTPEKIEMTAPVFMGQDGSGKTMSFVLPATYTLETAPQPKDPSLKLQEVKDYNVAAIRFSGLLSDKNIATHVEMLKKWIAENGYEATGAYQTAGYNPPWTIPMFRRNEVLIPVKKQ